MRVSNKVAYEMYLKCGYTVYRQVLDYYTGDKDEDAYGELHLQRFSLLIFSSRNEKGNAKR